MTTPMPVAPVQGKTHLRPGFDLGTISGKDFVIFNHLAFNVLIHKTHGEYTNAAKTNAITGAYIMDPANRRLLRYEEDATAGRTLAWPEGTPDAVVDALRARSASAGRDLLEDKTKKGGEKEDTDKEAGEEEKPEKKNKKKDTVDGAGEAATSSINSDTPESVSIQSDLPVVFLRRPQWPGLLW